MKKLTAKTDFRNFACSVVRARLVRLWPAAVRADRPGRVPGAHTGTIMKRGSSDADDPWPKKYNEPPVEGIIPTSGVREVAVVANETGS